MSSNPFRCTRVRSTACMLAVFAALGSSTTMSQDAGGYVGFGVGQSRAKIDTSRMLDTEGVTGVTGLVDDDRDTSWKVLGGYQFNRHLAIEGGYFELGTFGFTAQSAGPLASGQITGKMYVKGFNADLVGLLPFTERLSGTARAGINYARVEDTFTGAGVSNLANPAPTERGTNYKLGLGLQYALSPALAGRLEVERYRIDDALGHNADFDFYQVGLVYRFGTHVRPPVALVQPMPVSVAPQPVQQLVVVPAPKSQYCSILDIGFEIDNGDIQRAEKEKLAVLATFLKKYPDTTAVIEGHTDDVGGADYNQKLSQQRADGVVGYLVDAQQINPARLKAVGYGETRPLASNDTQEGKRQNRRIDALIACVTDIAGLDVAPARITLALLLEFDAGSADVRAQYHDQLASVATFLKDNPATTATVEGHTGNLQANAAASREIAQRRATNVVAYLVANFGVDPSRLAAEGFGKARRFAYNTDAEGQQENRRVNIVINYPKR